MDQYSSKLVAIEEIDSLDVFQNMAPIYEARVRKLSVIDAATHEQAALFIGGFKTAEKWLEAKRTELVKPLNDEVSAMNKLYKPVIDTFLAMRKRVEQMKGEYEERERKRIETEQRKAIEAAEHARLMEEAKAASARISARIAAGDGDLAAALKFEAKADKFDAKAEAIIPAMVQQAQNTVTLGGSTVSETKGKQDWQYKDGRPKDAKVFGNDAMFSEWTRLEWGVYNKYFCVDPVRVNAALKAGETLPKCFLVGTTYGGTVVRGGK